VTGWSILRCLPNLYDPAPVDSRHSTQESCGRCRLLPMQSLVVHSGSTELYDYATTPSPAGSTTFTVSFEAESCWSLVNASLSHSMAWLVVSGDNVQRRCSVFDPASYQNLHFRCFFDAIPYTKIPTALYYRMVRSWSLEL